MDVFNRFMRSLPFPLKVVAVYLWWLVVLVPGALLWGIVCAVERAWNDLQGLTMHVVMAWADRNRATPAPRKEPTNE